MLKTRLTLGLVSVLCAGGWVNGRQAAPGDVADLVRQAEARIRELHGEAEELARQSSTLLVELRKLEIERSIKAQEVRMANAELAKVSAALKQSEAQVASLEAERLASAAGVTERLVEIYKRGQSGYVKLLFAADDVQAFGRLSRAVATMAESDRLRFDAHRKTLMAEREALSQLAEQKHTLGAAQAAAVKAREALSAAVAAHTARLAQLDQRRDLAAQYVGELERATADLQRRVGDLTSQHGLTLPLTPFRGALEWPVAGRVLSPFGRTTIGKSATPIQRNGIELKASEGDAVRAVHGGTVAFAAPFVGFGTLVILDHGANAFTLYGHLQQTSVATGASVERGSVVGRAGRNPDGAEAVYFELRIDGRPVDPVQWLRTERKRQ
jgi:septal ring factor EnvC (AmiA/AmiB activator)